MKQQTSAATETGIKGKNIIDFTGKTLYVGIDVNQKDFQAAVVHEDVCLDGLESLDWCRKFGLV